MSYSIWASEIGASYWPSAAQTRQRAVASALVGQSVGPGGGPGGVRIRRTLVALGTRIGSRQVQGR